MFVRDKSLVRLEVTGAVVDLYRSLNRARIAPEGAESQPCDACVITMKTTGDVPSVFVVLFLTVSRERQVFMPEQQPVTMFEYERTLQEALDFAESIGFMLDSIETDGDPRRSAELAASIPALYLPGVDPLPAEPAAAAPHLADAAAIPAADDATAPPQAPTAARPSDLLARLRSLVQPEASAPVAPETFGMEASGELILDDLSLFEPDVPSHPGPVFAAEAAPSPADTVAPLDDPFDAIALFDEQVTLELEPAGDDGTLPLSFDDADSVGFSFGAVADTPDVAACAPEGDAPGTAVPEEPMELFAPAALEVAVEADVADDGDDLVFMDFADFDAPEVLVSPEMPEVMPSSAAATPEELPRATAVDAVLTAEETYAAEPLVAEVVDSDRPAVHQTTDLSRLAAGSILEQIGKLLGSL